MSHDKPLYPHISLVWLEVFAFYETIDIESSQGLVILLLSCVMEIVQFWIGRTDPPWFTDNADFEVGQIKALDLGVGDS